MNENNSYEIEISDNDEKDMNQVNDSNQKSVEEEKDKEQLKMNAQESSDENKYLDKLLRLQAEFANYKKRVEKERLEFSGYIKGELVSSLLPVIDDFERMLDHTNNEDNEFLKGIRLIYNKLMDVLKGQG